MARDVTGFISRARAALATPEVAAIRAGKVAVREAHQALLDKGLSEGVINFLQEVFTTRASDGTEYMRFGGVWTGEGVEPGGQQAVKLSDVAQFLAMPEGQAWWGAEWSKGHLQDPYLQRLNAAELGKFLQAKYRFVGGTAEERYRAGVYRGAGLGGGVAPTYGTQYGAPAYGTPYEAPAPEFFPEPRYEPEWYRFQEEKEFVSPAQKTYTERMFPSLFAKFEAGRAKTERQFAKTPFATEAEAKKAEEAREADWFAYLKRYPLEKEWWAKSEYERGERRPIFQPIVRTVKY